MLAKYTDQGATVCPTSDTCVQKAGTFTYACKKSASEDPAVAIHAAQCQVGCVGGKTGATACAAAHAPVINWGMAAWNVQASCYYAEMSCDQTGFKTTIGDDVMCAAKGATVGQQWGYVLTAAACATPTAAQHPAAATGSALQTKGWLQTASTASVVAQWEATPTDTQLALIQRPCAAGNLVVGTVTNNTGKQICYKCSLNALADAAACAATFVPITVAGATNQSARCGALETFCYQLELDCATAQTATKIKANGPGCKASATAKAYHYGCIAADATATAGVTVACNNTTGVQTYSNAMLSASFSDATAAAADGFNAINKAYVLKATCATDSLQWDKIAFNCFQGSANTKATDTAAASFPPTAATQCTGRTDAACWHVKIDCVAAETAKLLAATPTNFCKLKTKASEQFGCSATACTVTGTTAQVWTVPTADLELATGKAQKDLATDTFECSATSGFYKKAFSCMKGTVNNSATDVATAAKGDCASGGDAACYHIKVDCVTATTDKALKTTGNTLCKDPKKEAEEWGCTAAANCKDGVQTMPKAVSDVSFEASKQDKKQLTVATCSVKENEFATAAAAASTSSTGEAADKKADDKKDAGEDSKSSAYLFGVAAIAMLW